MALRAACEIGVLCQVYCNHLTICGCSDYVGNWKRCFYFSENWWLIVFLKRRQINCSRNVAQQTKKWMAVGRWCQSLYLNVRIGLWLKWSPKSRAVHALNSNNNPLPPDWSIWIFTHLKLYLAEAIPNFKWVKIIRIWQNRGQLFSNFADWCHILSSTCLKCGT